MSPCRFDHSDPDVLPAILCRVCNPPGVLVPSSELVAPVPKMLSAERVRVERQILVENLRLQHIVAHYGSDAKVATEKQRAKVARLEKKLAKLKTAD